MSPPQRSGASLEPQAAEPSTTSSPIAAHSRSVVLMRRLSTFRHVPFSRGPRTSLRPWRTTHLPVLSSASTSSSTGSSGSSLSTSASGEWKPEISRATRPAGTEKETSREWLIRRYQYVRGEKKAKNKEGRGDDSSTSELKRTRTKLRKKASPLSLKKGAGSEIVRDDTSLHSRECLCDACAACHSIAMRPRRIERAWRPKVSIVIEGERVKVCGDKTAQKKRQVPANETPSLRGGCLAFSGKRRLEDDEPLPSYVWWLAGGRPGIREPITGKQLREWKKKSRGEGKRRGFVKEVAFVMSRGKVARRGGKKAEERGGGGAEDGEGG